MFMAYTKLFSSIITSTIWMEPDQTRIVWITMLAAADKNGEVQGSIPGLARIAGVPIDATRDAVLRFLSPDPDSRTKDDEGRRIEVIDGGWRLLNHRKYREMCSRDEAREAEAKRKAAYRAKIARNPSSSQNVPDKSRVVPVCLHIADTDTKADADTENTSKTLGEPATPPAPTTKPKDLKVARTDADLIASYASNPAYRGIDVMAQLHKMRAWCAVNRKEPTERRFVNWLNRTDKPLGGDSLNGALMR